MKKISSPASDEDAVYAKLAAHINRMETAANEGANALERLIQPLAHSDYDCWETLVCAVEALRHAIAGPTHEERVT